MAELWNGPALVAFGTGTLPEVGAFRVDLGGGLLLSGFREQAGGAAVVEGRLGGRHLDLPRQAMVFLAASLVGVAGGPADPEAWDVHFGGARSDEGDAERLARHRKANALPAPLAALYQEVRVLRHAHRAYAERLAAILEALKAYPEDWLLAREVEGLIGVPVA